MMTKTAKDYVRALQAIATVEYTLGTGTAVEQMRNSGKFLQLEAKLTKEEIREALIDYFKTA